MSWQWEFVGLLRLSVVHRHARAGYWRVCFPDDGEEHRSGKEHKDQESSLRFRHRGQQP